MKNLFLFLYVPFLLYSVDVSAKDQDKMPIMHIILIERSENAYSTVQFIDQMQEITRIINIESINYRINIEKKEDFGRLRENIKKNDLVCFYFAGHGLSSETYQSHYALLKQELGGTQAKLIVGFMEQKPNLGTPHTPPPLHRNPKKRNLNQEQTRNLLYKLFLFGQGTITILAQQKQDSPMSLLDLFLDEIEQAYAEYAAPDLWEKILKNLQKTGNYYYYQIDYQLLPEPDQQWKPLGNSRQKFRK